MAEVDVAPTFGAELKDGFKPASAWVANGIAWLDDIQGFYRERSAIEKEYSAKLNALAKKYFEKKNKKSATLSVGDTPAMTPGSLENASLTIWTTHLTTLESRADEHEKYGNELISKVADPLKYYATKFEELRKRHADYAGKLEAERESSYADLRKVKGKYDTVCQEVESRRKKTESSFDKAKAQSHYQQQLQDMNNVKNTYLISINVTNKLKERYYHEYVPELLDSLQDLSEFRTLRLNAIWSTATGLETNMLKNSQGLLEHLSQEITRNQPHLDSMMYIRHNLNSWQEPSDKGFEPSPVWHDDDAMVTDEAAKVYLRNVLNKSKSQLGDLRREVDKKKRDVESVKRIKNAIREGREKKDEVLVVSQMFDLQDNLHQTDRKRLTAEVETSTITSVIGDVTLGAKNHNFKSQTFKIPTNCDLCGERIWGLSAKGFDCRDCGYAASAHRSISGSVATPHSPAVDETPPEPGPRPPVSAAPKKPRIMAPPPTNYICELPGDSTNGPGSAHATEQKGKVLYSFEANGAGELSVPEGREVIILEPDDGAGWIKVRLGYKEGLVPATYLEVFAAPIAPQGTGSSMNNRPASTYSNSGSSVGTAGAAAAAAKKKGPAVAPRRGAKKLKYVVAMYEYTAQSDAEHSMAEGERFVLIKDDPGDGWVEVEKGGATKSVPASYVQVATD
ncbi:putative actin polymerization protein bzz1 protein [Eutypa lata UCREL1]|uniref:Protein BZZ1 n=1 Tax=Eutypa lata (strain UCR-EL1) TaxID=1287681 RepID=M7T4J9_EUTLA|nr:putative actin polymerization protein bzz1 protein [Eutypa lata UCREL1]